MYEGIQHMTPPPNRTGFRPPDLLRALLDHFRRRATTRPPGTDPTPVWFRLLSGTHTFELGFCYGKLVTLTGTVTHCSINYPLNGRTEYNIEVDVHHTPPITTTAPWKVHPPVLLMIDGMPPSLEVIDWDYDDAVGRKTFRVRFYV